jgi:tetratricopeptide (TPR) repeat protein
MNLSAVEGERMQRIYGTLSLFAVAHLAVAILVCAVSLPAQKKDDLAAGLNEFQAGNYSQAAALFEEAEASAPGATAALLLEGQAYVRLDQFPAADNALRRYLVAHTNSDEALYLLGYVLHRENRAAESLETYTKAARLRAPRGDDFKIVGLNYVLLNDYPDAINWLEKAVETEPRNKEAWYFLGRAYYTRARIGDAGKAFSKALEIQPRDAKAENNLGLVLEAEAQTDAALDAYRKAIEWQRQDRLPSEQPYLNLGSLLLDQSRLAEALPPLQKAFELAPSNPTCALKLGTTYLRMERLEEARPHLEKAVELAPKDPAGHYQLGRLYKGLKMTALANAEFEKTEELQRQAASSKPEVH